MNEELHWQPMASKGPGATTAPADLRRPRDLGYAAQAIRESIPRDRRPKTAWPWV